jgi:hypothetical protein
VAVVEAIGIAAPVSATHSPASQTSFALIVTSPPRPVRSSGFAAHDPRASSWV